MLRCVRLTTLARVLRTLTPDHLMDYKDLLVWQATMELCETTYRLTSAFPKHELFGLTAQLRRSAISVPSNIAEGEGRLTWGERRQFLSHARGSLFELETQFLIAGRLGYIEVEDIIANVAAARRQLDGYIAYVRTR
jgi:four helix bundle protein